MSGKKISDFGHLQGSKVWASCAVLLDVSSVCQFCEIGTLLKHICLIDSHITPKANVSEVGLIRKYIHIIITL